MNPPKNQISAFPYPSLDPAKNEIRLLYPVTEVAPPSSPAGERYPQPGYSYQTECVPRLSYELRSVSLDDAPTYTALSYVWGMPDPPETITVNGLPFSVGPNLYSALSNLTFENIGPVIWIDAICINQADNAEKNNQIPKMAAIYSGALEVLIWLGEATPECREFVQIVHRLLELAQEKNRKDPASSTGFGTIMELSYEAIEDIRQVNIDHRVMFPDIETLLEFFVSHIQTKEWWFRIWIIQEWVVAKHAYFHIGPHRIEGYAILLLLICVVYLIRDQRFPLLDDERVTRRFKLMISEAGPDFLLDLFCLRMNRPGEHRTILKTFQSAYSGGRAAKRHAKDDRDRVFALRGLAEKDFERMGIAVDYTKECHEVYIQLAQSFIQSGRLEILSFCGFRDIDRADPCQPISRPDVCDCTKLPTWTPDWTSPVQGIHTACQTDIDGLYAAGGSTSTVSSFPPRRDESMGYPRMSVKLRAHQVDEITVIGSPPFQENASRMDRKSWILEHYEAIGRMIETSEKLESKVYTKTQLEEAHWRIPTWDLEGAFSNEKYYRRATEFTKSRYFLLLNVLRTVRDGDPREDPESPESPSKTGKLLATFWYILRWILNRVTVLSRQIIYNYYTRNFRWLIGLLSTAVLPIGWMRANRNTFYDIAYYSGLVLTRGNGRLFLTQRGYIGYGPESVKAGDIALIFHGARVPHVVRKRDRGRPGYTLVGDAFLYGAMDGELMKDVEGDSDIELF